MGPQRRETSTQIRPSPACANTGYGATQQVRRDTRSEGVTAMGGYNAFLATTLPPEHRIYDPDAESL